MQICERDHNGDSLMVWSYPGTDAEMDAHVLKRCRLEMKKVNPTAAMRKTTATVPTALIVAVVVLQ